MFHPQDPRASTTSMSDGTRAEIKGLMKRGTCKTILKEDFPLDTNVLPGRFVLALESAVDIDIKFKARFVIAVHLDRMKGMTVHDAATVQPQSIRPLLHIAEMNSFRIWRSDVRKAYIQYLEPISRELIIKKPAPGF